MRAKQYNINITSSYEYYCYFLRVWTHFLPNFDKFSNNNFYATVCDSCFPMSSHFLSRGSRMTTVYKLFPLMIPMELQHATSVFLNTYFQKWIIRLCTTLPTSKPNLFSALPRFWRKSFSKVPPANLKPKL